MRIEKGFIPSYSIPLSHRPRRVKEEAYGWDSKCGWVKVNGRFILNLNLAMEGKDSRKIFPRSSSLAREKD
jgi:hypothetical protein